MPKDQLHKRFIDAQVKMLLQLYEAGTLTEQQVCDRLQIGRSRFFTLLQNYQHDPANFTVRYRRSAPPSNRVGQETDAAIFAELERQKTLILNPALPIRYYHYREARDAVCMEHGITLCDETVRRRITHDEYDKLIVQTKAQEEQLHDEMRSHGKADETFLISCSYLLELLKRASDLFERSQAAQKNHLLRFVLENGKVEGENLIYELKSPFAGIAQCIESKEWLPLLDAMRTDWFSSDFSTFQIIHTD
ncbi:hypothetical protein HY213_01755 [Candidatus Peregrinibacteria bacterium]|nr:hypothetical protein [Candidatus Peregrinibacteria bacterium]